VIDRPERASKNIREVPGRLSAADARIHGIARAYDGFLGRVSTSEKKFRGSAIRPPTCWSGRSLRKPLPMAQRPSVTAEKPAEAAVDVAYAGARTISLNPVAGSTLLCLGLPRR
jgi:hypothetical protein